MRDLIDRQEAIKMIEKLQPRGRKTGVWIGSPEGNPTESMVSVYCSACGEWSEYATNYCGHCGAAMLMRKEEEKHDGK